MADAEPTREKEACEPAKRFVWPPLKPPGGPPEPLSPRRRAPLGPDVQSGRTAGIVESVERVWLGLRRAPWNVRCSDSGWHPDTWDRYCPRCATSITASDTDRLESGDATGCTVCRTKDLPWDRAVRLGEFEGLLRTAIHEVKFTKWRRLGTDLGTQLGFQVLQALRAERVDLRRVVVAPVASSLLRRLVRGIDHAAVLARGVAQALGCPTVSLLTRSHRPSQVDLPPSSRAANARGSFRVRPGALGGTPLIVLVDDVRTTGATLTAACREIRRAQSRAGNGADCTIWTAVVAVTPQRANSGTGV